MIVSIRVGVADVRKLVRAVGGDKAWKTWPASLQRGLLLDRWNAIDDYQVDYSTMFGATQCVMCEGGGVGGVVGVFSGCIRDVHQRKSGYCGHG